MNGLAIIVIAMIMRGLYFLLAILSPLALIVILVSGINIIESVSSHHQFVKNLEAESMTAEAVVSSISLTEEWILLRYSDSERSGVLEFQYYPPDVRRNLEAMSAGDVILIHHLSPETRGSDRVIVAGRLANLQSYRGFLDDRTAVLLAFSIMLLILKPQLLCRIVAPAFDQVCCENSGGYCYGKSRN